MSRIRGSALTARLGVENGQSTLHERMGLFEGQRFGRHLRYEARVAIFLVSRMHSGKGDGMKVIGNEGNWGNEGAEALGR